MQDTDLIQSIEIPPSNWRKFHFDDEFFINRAILDLQAQDPFENLSHKGLDSIDLQRLQEDCTLQLISSRFFPNLFLISIQ